MTHGYARTVAFASVLFALPSCSLIGLSQYDVARCTETDRCDALNDRLDVTACVRWNCEPSTDLCVLGPRDLDGDGDPDPLCSRSGHDCDETNALRSSRGVETCDGYDNDCDTRVDENVVAPAPVDILTTALEMPQLTYAAHGPLLVLRSATAGYLVRNELSTRLSEIRHAMPAPQPDDEMGMNTWGMLLPGDLCPSPTHPPPPMIPSFVTDVCNEADAAIDVTGDGSALIATIGDDLCAGRGLLRVGTLDGAGRQRLQGPSSISSTWFGIDRMGSCTGVEGAARPTLTFADDMHALLTWQRAGVNATPACLDGADIEVTALVLTVGRAVVGGAADVPFVTAADPAPIVLGRAGALHPVSVVAWSDVGWLVAFPDTTGAIALRIVHTNAAPTDMLPSISGRGPVATVALALGPGDTESRVVGLGLVASRTESGECSTDRPASFARVRIDRMGLTTELLGSADLGVASQLASTYVERGLTATPAGEAGGWLVLGARRGVMDAWRFAAADGAQVDADPIRVGVGTLAPDLRAHDENLATFTYLRPAVAPPTTHTLVTGELLCPPPPPPPTP